MASPVPSQFQIGTVRRHLHDILSQPEYNRAFGASPVDRFWESVSKLIERGLGWFGNMVGLGSSTAGRIASLVFACLVIVAFLWVLSVVIRKLARQEAGTRDDEASRRAEAYGLPSSGPLIRQAAQLAGSGDFRGAFRFAYLASISHLDEVGSLRFERSRTNWEYMRELERRGLTKALSELRPVTLDFDRKIYGREGCTAEDYRRAVEAYGAVSREAAG